MADEHLADAAAAVQRLDALARRVGAVEASADTAVLDRFRDAMDDDFNTPTAVAVLMDALRDANAALDAGDGSRGASLAAAALEVARTLGLEPKSAGAELPEDAVAKARERDEARASKDWARADALRDELVAAGYVVEDTPEGTRIRR